MAVSAGALLLAAGAAHAQQSPAPDGGVFTLGQINVSAQADGQRIGGSTLPADDLWTFNRPTLDQALDLVPGVSVAKTGGPRNEQLVTVRGFNRFQVPLYLDGVRVYLPADGRLDFGRFLTSDLSEIQVSKGYASVLDGPGGMGGAINLVTRKPTKPFDGEARGGIALDNNGALNGYTSTAIAGTKQERFYLQASGAKTERTHVRLSDQFTASRSENGGNRDQSQSEDWRINLKAGFTPNDTDEYSLSFLKQSGSKGAPLNINETAANQRYWSWPDWDVQSLYWLSSTTLGEASYVKTKLYRNVFDNSLSSYDDATLTRQRTSRSFRSYYTDKAYGGSVEAGTDLIPRNTLKGAVHYRRDDHKEWQDLFAPRPFTEPRQQTVEDSWSLALENSWHATDRLDVVLGVSHNWRHLSKAQDWNGTATGSLIDYRRADAQSTDGQGAVVYRYSPTGAAHASVSSRTRFPTIFERFSTRFGGAASNPDLKPERSTNYEIGASDTLFGNTRVEGALFYSDIQDAIANFPITIQGQSAVQSRNAASGSARGAELAVTTRLSATLEVGGNYALLLRRLSDPNLPDIKPIDTPNHKLFVYATVKPLEGLTITPNIEAASSRYSQSTQGTVFIGNGGYALVNVQAGYAFNANAEVTAGVRNLLDTDYSVFDGLPEAGRTFYVNARYKF